MVEADHLKVESDKTTNPQSASFGKLGKWLIALLSFSVAIFWYETHIPGCSSARAKTDVNQIIFDRLETIGVSQNQLNIEFVDIGQMTHNSERGMRACRATLLLIGQYGAKQVPIIYTVHRTQSGSVQVEVNQGL